MAAEMVPNQTKRLSTRSGISFTKGMVPQTMSAGTHNQLPKLELHIKQNAIAKIRFTAQAIISDGLLVIVQSLTNLGSYRASANPIPNGSMPPMKL